MPSCDVSSDKFALLKWKHIFPSCKGERMLLLIHSRALRFFQIWESETWVYVMADPSSYLFR